jgi:hypothetical protein
MNIIALLHATRIGIIIIAVSFSDRIVHEKKKVKIRSKIKRVSLRCIRLRIVMDW